MRLGRLALVALGTLLLTGCAYLDAMREDLDARLEQWVAEEEYGRALDTLRYVDRKHPRYATLVRQRQRIQKLARKFEQRTIRRARGLVERGEWHEAAMLLEDALDKLPGSQPLKTAWQDFLARRNAYLRQVRFNLLLSRAERLVRDLPVMAEIRRVVPTDAQVEREYRALEEDATRTATELAQCAADALAARNIDLADHCLSLAQGLRPDETTRHRLAVLDQKLSQHRTAEHRREMAGSHQVNRALLNQFDAAFRARDLATAKRIMDQIMARDVRPAGVHSRQEQLQAAIDRRVQEGLVTGRSLYSQGRIQEALAEWKGVLALQPDNKALREHIERAERVLDKLRRLSTQKPAS